MGIIYTMTEAMEFLDGLIKDNERYNINRHLSNHIYAIERPKCIHLGEGIEILADVLPVELKVTDPDMPYFCYKDYLVYQMKGSTNDG